MFAERNEGVEYGTVQTGISFLPCDMSSLGFFSKETVILLVS